MSRREVITLEDDIDGSEASETVQFSLDGTRYEIDLNVKNARQLRKALSGYVAHARKAKGGKRKAPSRPRIIEHSSREIRDWARSQGVNVPDRGRIPAQVREQFQQAVA